MKNRIVTTLILAILFSCVNKNEGSKSFHRKKKNYTSEATLDSLNDVKIKLRDFICKTSTAPKSTINENFKLLDYYFYAFVTLNEIPKDSIKIHAPLSSVNKIVIEYNSFVDKNIGDDVEMLDSFKSEKEYLTKKNEYISLVLRNEIKLHKKHGYIIDKFGKPYHIK